MHNTVALLDLSLQDLAHEADVFLDTMFLEALKLRSNIAGYDRQGHQLGMGVSETGSGLFAVVFKEDDCFKPPVFKVSAHALTENEEHLGDLPIVHVHHLPVLNGRFDDDLVDTKTLDPAVDPFCVWFARVVCGKGRILVGNHSDFPFWTVGRGTIRTVNVNFGRCHRLVSGAKWAYVRFRDCMR
jgi:hypothetical protein